MNKMTLLGAGLCAAWLCSGPAWAEEPALKKKSAATPPPPPEYTLNYRVKPNGPEQSIAEPHKQPLQSLLQVLQHSIREAQQDRGNEMEIQMRARDKDDLSNELPPLTLKTQALANGPGQSLLSSPPFKRQEKRGGVDGMVDWKGMTLALNYNDVLVKPSGQLSVPGLHLNIDGEVDMSFHTLKLDFALDERYKPLSLSGSLPVFSAKVERDDFSLQDVSFDLNMRQVQPQLKLPDGRVHMGAFKFKEGGGFEVGFKQFDLNSRSQLQGEVVNTGISLDLRELLLPPDLNMPEQSTLNLRTNLNLDAIDAQSLAQLQTLALQLHEQNMPEELIGITVMGKILELTPALVARSPEFRLDKLQLQSAEGVLNGHLRIALKGDKPLNLQQQGAWLQSIQGDAMFTIDKGLLRGYFISDIRSEQAMLNQQQQQKKAEPFTPAQLAQLADIEIGKLVQQGYLTEPQPGKYQLKAELNNGEAFVNGKKMEGLF